MAIKLNLNPRRRILGRAKARPISHSIVRDMIRGQLEHVTENKLFTNTIGATNATAAGVITPLSQEIVQGDNLDARTGDKIVMKHLTLRLQTTLNVALTTATIRFILFADTMANGSVPVVGDVLSASTVTASYQCIALLKNRFKILIDKTIPMVLGGSNQTVSTVAQFKLDMPVYYQNTNNVAGANSKNCLFALIITDAAATPPIYSFTTQHKYVDV
nr:structural protein [Riboviria sp.]